MIHLEETIQVLHGSRVRFILIGGMAAVTHGVSQFTRDMDFCYERSLENLKALASCLAPYHPRLRGAPDNLPFLWDEKTLKAGLNFTLTTDLGEIDILGEVAGLGTYEQVLPYSESLDLWEIPCLVLNLEGLLISKKAAGRPKDQAVILELEALAELRRRPGEGD